uniref:hypothetical protein n=1 Tax=Acetatifactor sp. TaxID=1872090 RepID=UPI0040579F61
MAFGSIEITTITRAQDYTTIKHNEDNKGYTDQTNIGNHIQKEVQQRPHEVQGSDNSDWHTRQFDAKDKGDNQYDGDGGRQRKREEKKEQVIVKGRKSFDIKI